MRSLAIAIVTVLIALCAVRNGLQALAEECSAAGTRTRETYLSGVSTRERKFRLYLPPCYQASEASYPLLLLLHGSNADDSQWARLGFLDALDSAIRAGEAPPMIVVMPHGGSIANQNYFNGLSYDTILLDLLEHVGDRYRLDGRQAIGGISRGGFWAFHLGLRFAADFVAIGGHSPYFDPDHAPPLNNPLDLARSLTADTRLRLWLDRGPADHAAVGVDQMHVLLRERRIPHAYIVHAAGDHSEATWRQNMGAYVAFYAGAFAGRDDLQVARAAAEQDAGIELWLPAAGFGALLTSIYSPDFDALLAGALDERLIFSHTNAERLRERGIDLHWDTRLVPDERLFNELWRDKRSFTLLPFDQLRPRLRPLWLDDAPVVDQLTAYPLSFESDAPNFSPDNLTRVTLSGTTALARRTLPAVARMGLEQAASGIRDYVRRADFFQITHEASIAATCPRHTESVLGGANSMCMLQDHAPLFDILDVDVVDLTGNHINDFGYEAFDNTLTRFEDRGYALVGGGRSVEQARQPLVLERNGSRIGWLACNNIGPYYAFANDDPNALGGRRPGNAYCRGGGWLREALPRLAADVDLVLLTVQYREFEAFTPTPRQRIDYQTYAEWGADIVIGTAEHKPMTFEFYRTRRGETAFLHYGLGNLFFDQAPWGNRRFFLDTLYIYDGELRAVELFPGVIEERARPRLLAGDDLFNFLHFMFIQKNEF